MRQPVPGRRRFIAGGVVGILSGTIGVLGSAPPRMVAGMVARSGVFPTFDFSAMVVPFPALIARRKCTPGAAATAKNVAERAFAED